MTHVPDYYSGVPDWCNDDDEPEYMNCPICGEECERIYYDKDKNVVGCDTCLSWCYPDEVEDMRLKW